MSKDSEQTFVVTGANGFIAAHVVAQLLAGGHRVRATVRNPDKVAELAYLRALPGATERLELVKADLMSKGAFDSAVQGADFVLHMASPFVIDAKDPQKDLVDPAVSGTTSVLESCAKSPSVKRVVLTSSMAAITDEPDSDHTLTEADWNTLSTLERNAYYLSKTLAERAAWSFCEERKPSYDLVAINPYIVIGPSLSKSISASNQIFIDLLSGVYPGIVNLTWGFVDVRDVAFAHIAAATLPEAKGRYLCSGETITMRKVVELLNTLGYTQYKLPKVSMDCAAGDFSVKLGSYLQPKGIGSYLRTHVGRSIRYDNSKIKRDLGVVFRPVEDSIRETLENLGKLGLLPNAK
jgi:dihydroflavonol-4-reductase